MTQLFVNNFAATVAQTFGATDQYLFLNTVTGLPALTGGNYLLLTLFRKVGVVESGHEVIKITAITDLMLTVERSVEGADATLFNVGDRVEARVTAGALGLKADVADAYVHPANHPASIITQDADNRFVTDVEKAGWDAKQSAGNYATGGGTATGTNTGDETLATIKTKLGVTTLSGANTGDQTLSGLGGQPLDADLTAIAALTGTTGLLKKTAADTWTLDTTAYALSGANTDITSLQGVSVGRGGGNVVSNTRYGTNALNANTEGAHNTAIGTRSLINNTTGYSNNAVGYESLYSNSTGINNTAIGEQALYSNTSGTENIAIGSYSLLTNIGGSNNIAIGNSSLAVSTSASNNTTIGTNSGSAITTGNNNVVIGSNNGGTIATTNNNIILSDGSGNIRMQTNSSGVTNVVGSLTVNGSSVGDVTLAGVQTLANKTLTGYTETVYNLEGTVIDVANGSIQTKTLAANTTFTESLADGQSVVLGITAGSFSVTWPAGTLWNKVGGSGVAPTLTSTGVNWIVLWQVGGVLRGAFMGTA